MWQTHIQSSIIHYYEHMKLKHVLKIQRFLSLACITYDTLNNGDCGMWGPYFCYIFPLLFWFGFARFLIFNSKGLPYYSFFFVSCVYVKEVYHIYSKATMQTINAIAQILSGATSNQLTQILFLFLRVRENKFLSVCIT